MNGGVGEDGGENVKTRRFTRETEGDELFVSNKSGSMMLLVI